MRSFAEMYNHFKANKYIDEDLTRFDFKMLKLLKEMPKEIRQQVIMTLDNHAHRRQILLAILIIALFSLGAIVGGLIGYGMAEIKHTIQNTIP